MFDSDLVSYVNSQIELNCKHKFKKHTFLFSILKNNFSEMNIAFTTDIRKGDTFKHLNS